MCRPTNQSYKYDLTGNATSGGGRTFSWSAENQPLTIVKTGAVTENYVYNADNERVKLTTTLPTTTTTTFYFGGMAEETLAGTKSTKRHVYTFNGQVIAQRDVFPSTTPSTFRYLHGDHLGSVSATSTSGSSPTVTRQYFTAWGDARQGSLATTTDRNFTGQRKDDTGLLFYNARYYDPKLSRFLSADSIVPQMASSAGGKGTISYLLTVDFHEPKFALNVGSGYDQAAFNPQSLNRYSYVLNNPLRYTDPTGHHDAPGGCDTLSGQGCGGSPPGPTSGGTASGGTGGGGSPIEDPNTDPKNEQRRPNDKGNEKGGSKGESGGGGKSGFGEDQPKNWYDRKTDAPKYPGDFVQGQKPMAVKVNNKGLLEKLRGIEKGVWQKVYENGYSNGRKVSLHYFRSASGKIFDLWTDNKWVVN